MITYMNASRRDMENLMSTRLEMLREVNDLSEDDTFPDNLVDSSRLYFEDGNQTTILAMDGRKVVGCASAILRSCRHLSILPENVDIL